MLNDRGALTKAVIVGDFTPPNVLVTTELVGMFREVLRTEPGIAHEPNLGSKRSTKSKIRRDTVF